MTISNKLLNAGYDHRAPAGYPPYISPFGRVILKPDR